MQATCQKPILQFLEAGIKKLEGKEGEHFRGINVVGLALRQVVSKTCATAHFSSALAKVGR